MTWALPTPPHMGAFLHTREALSERYLITLTLSEYEALCEQLREQDWFMFNHPCVLSSDERYGRILIRWRIYGTPTKLIYCPKAGLVITALPYGSTYWENHERKFIRQQARKRRAYTRKQKHKRAA